MRDGILRHSTGAGEPATLEGKIVRLVDRIAYINHDIDDAVRAGVLAVADLPAEEIAVLGDTGLAADRPLVHDLVEHSERGGRHRAGRGGRRRDAPPARRSCSSTSTSGRLARAEHAKIERVHARRCSSGSATTRRSCRRRDGGASEADRVIDYLAGMTDRFAIRAWTERAVPQGLLA